MIERYQQMDVATATPAGLVAKLYDAAIRHATDAGEHMRAGRVPERARSLSKVIAIVGELHGTLDMERGGEIAANLDQLYGFVLDRLLAANLESSTDALDEAVRILVTLNEGWQHVARTSAGAGSAR